MNLLGNVQSPVENHDLVPSLQHIVTCRPHSRLPKCDDLLIVQIYSNPVNRMLTAPSSVQAEMSKVFHSSHRPIWHSSEQQVSTVHISSSRTTSMDNRCSEHKLVRSHSIRLPFNGTPSQGDLGEPICNCFRILIATGSPGMPRIWDLVQLLMEIPVHLPV